ncbi:hypothetical protein FB562_2102 [Homoserinimonas aerilata]|uniref:Alpha/beta hydrolase family protein n=1 Tax=Homoserinimonas aerilata TaxID=1162970 RepID=A0A542YES2_9MICO|nr:hypothetical protein [Homoserinimonas aerilata]TQL46578.1 hypothetical protein FB562_2102 [Homoserinimonas aerilata]
MSDDLSVSGGGMHRVTTAEIGGYSAQLRQLSEEVASCRMLLDRVDRVVTGEDIVMANLPYSAALAEGAIDEARFFLEALVIDGQMLAGLLDTAASGYGLAEAMTQSMLRELAGRQAYGLGALMSSVPAIGGLFLLGAGVSVAGFAALAAIDQGSLVARWLEMNREVLNDPRTVELVRLGVMSVDDFGGGLLGLPSELVAFLGSDQIAVTGLAGTATVLTAGARAVGLLREGPVAATRMSKSRIDATAPSAVPAGFADRAARIPPSPQQIRIDRYEVTGEPDRFEVYIAGTKDFSPVTGEDPWDLTSNLGLVSGSELAGSTRALVQAMADAGVTAETPVMLTGHSQGAMLAMAVAGSGDYDVRGVLTLGGPTGQMDSPDVPVLKVEHAGDLVIAAGGLEKSTTAVIVTRDLFANTTVPLGTLLPSHDLSRYQQTAALIDGSGEAHVTAVGKSFDSFTRGAVSVETSTWQARRISEDATATR